MIIFNFFICRRVIIIRIFNFHYWRVSYILFIFIVLSHITLVGAGFFLNFFSSRIIFNCDLLTRIIVILRRWTFLLAILRRIKIKIFIRNRKNFFGTMLLIFLILYTAFRVNNFLLFFILFERVIIPIVIIIII